MHRVQRERSFLALLKASTPRQRKLLVKSATPSQVASLCEVSYNLLRNNVPLSSHRLKHLRRYKKPLRLLANKKISLKKKKHYLNTNQTGGFLPLLAGLIPGLLGGLLNA